MLKMCSSQINVVLLLLNLLDDVFVRPFAQNRLIRDHCRPTFADFCCVMCSEGRASRVLVVYSFFMELQPAFLLTATVTAAVL